MRTSWTTSSAAGGDVQAHASEPAVPSGPGGGIAPAGPGLADAVRHPGTGDGVEQGRRDVPAPGMGTMRVTDIPCTGQGAG